MSENQALAENIQDFFNGSLDEAAREQLLTQASANEDLKQEMAFSRKLVQAIEYREHLGMAVLLGAIANTETLPPTKGGSSLLGSSFKMALLVGLALSTLAVLIVGYRQAWWTSASASSQMAQSMLVPLENTLFTGTEMAQVRQLKLGMKAYDAGDYALALKHLNRHIQQQPDANATLYLGVSYLMVGQTKQGIDALESCKGQLPPPLLETAYWYLALGYAQEDHKEQAKNALMQVPDGGVYGADKNKLLQSLAQ